MRGWSQFGHSSGFCTVLCISARFSLEQSQTRGDRLETRLEATLKELHLRPALHPQNSEEGLAQSAEDAPEGSTTSAADRGGVTQDDKSDEVWNITMGMECNCMHLCRWRLCKENYKK